MRVWEAGAIWGAHALFQNIPDHSCGWESPRLCRPASRWAQAGRAEGLSPPLHLHRANALEEQLKEQELRACEMALEEARRHRELVCKMERERSIEVESLQARWGTPWGAGLAEGCWEWSRVRGKGKAP